jgi:hypothetical protein
MKFEYDGVSYLIEFERTTKDRPAHLAYRVGLVKRVPKAVQTTARILKVTGPLKTDRELFREYTVGHHFRDKFSLEGGRKAALTMALYDAPTKGGGKALMGKTLSKDFRTVVWNAYHNR